MLPVDIATRQPRPRHLKGHEAGIEALAFSADGRKLLSIGHDNTARCWDLDDQEESRVVRKGRREINGLSFSPDGRYVVESSRDGIRVHDLGRAGSVSDRSTPPPRSLTTRPSRSARRILVSFGKRRWLH